MFAEETSRVEPPTEFFGYCFHHDTYAEVAFLRRVLVWRRSSTDRFISAVMLGILRGVFHRSGRYLKNRMPRTEVAPEKLDRQLR